MDTVTVDFNAIAKRDAFVFERKKDCLCFDVVYSQSPLLVVIYREVYFGLELSYDCRVYVGGGGDCCVMGV